ncbi:MAG: hypothetical protein IR160_02025 [Salinibacterium sp.]|nr:hypothetical protein [Salinibacterium sp.]MBF0671345.1 hypothetical protein [Salinibacterium sp.]
MEIIWGIGTLVLGAVLGVAFQRGADQWFNALTDYELWVDYVAVPLSTQTKAASELRYFVGNTELKEPHHIQLYVWRVGEKDVRADAFGDDLTIGLGVPIAPDSLRVIDYDGAVDLSFETGDDAKLLIRPSLIRPDFVLSYSFISDGLPRIHAHNPVADLKMSSFYAESRNKNRIGTYLAAAGGLLLVGGLLAMVSMGFLTNVVPDLVAARIMTFSLPATLIGIVMLATSSTISPRRARLARKLLRSRTNRWALSEPQFPARDQFEESLHFARK